MNTDTSITLGADHSRTSNYHLDPSSIQSPDSTSHTLRSPISSSSNNNHQSNLPSLTSQNDLKAPDHTNNTSNPRKHSSSPSLLRDGSDRVEISWLHRFRFSKVQYALLILLSIQTVMVVSILSATVAKIQREIQMMNPQLKTISTYLAIYIIANVFSIVIAIDALLNKNVAQLIALDLFNISMAVYGAVLPTQIKRSLHTPGGAVSWNGAREGTSCNMYLSCFGVQYLYPEIKGWIIAIPLISGCCSALMCYLTWLIYKEIGWEIFKLIGADLNLKRIAQKKCLFYMIQKFVFFFFVGFSLQFLMLSADVSAIEKALTIAALPFSLAAIVLGGVAIRNEIRWMLGVYYIVLSGATVYFVYKLIRLYNNDSISSAVKSLTFFSVLTIMSLFATGVAAGICYMEFGRGLLNASGGVNESIWLTMIRDGLSRNKKDTEKGEEGLAGGRDYTKEEFSSQSGQGDYSNGTTGQMVESNLMSDRRAPNFQVQSAHGRAQSKGSMGHQNSAVRNNRMSLD